MSTKLTRKFYTQPALKVAKQILGKYLIQKINKKKFIGKIVEIEAYVNSKDKASHAFGNKITKRNKAEYLIGGHIYIYLVYGMYWQLNITTGKANHPECILIRALEPIQGFNKNLSEKEIKNLANGPGKLCKWMKLDKSFYGEDITKSKKIWIESREQIKPSQIISSKRIGIDYAEEWADKLWRFYIKDSPFISKP